MIGHAGAALALILAQTAAQPTPPPRPCITPEEAGAGAAVMLPEMVEAVRRGCERHLPETAFLRTQGSQLIERWRSENMAQRQIAMPALMRMMSPQANAAAVPTGSGSPQASASTGAAQSLPSAAAMLPQMMSGIEGALAARMTRETCKEASRLVEALAPLPAGNVAQLVSATMSLGVAMTPPKADGGPPICRT